jgi:hypothetical protein
VQETVFVLDAEYSLVTAKIDLGKTCNVTCTHTGAHFASRWPCERGWKFCRDSDAKLKAR